MPWAEVKDATATANPRRPAAEDLAALEPGHEDQLVRRRNAKRLAIHLRLLDLDAGADTFRDRVARIHHPHAFPLARLTPAQRTARAHKPLKDF